MELILCFQSREGWLGGLADPALGRRNSPTDSSPGGSQAALLSTKVSYIYTLCTVGWVIFKNAKKHCVVVAKCQKEHKLTIFIFFLN